MLMRNRHGVRDEPVSVLNTLIFNHAQNETDTEAETSHGQSA
jgi:hypothetical protein